MYAAFRAAARLGAYLAWTLALMPFQWLALALGRPLFERLPMLYHHGVCAILGITVERRGKASAARPVLFICNHGSYVDIEALGATVAGCFVAKQEIAAWPLFGLLARLQRSVFVERNPTQAAVQCREIAARLDAGDNIFLFPEGTSSDGNRVLPFKSALFAVADRASLVIQPVTIAYTRLNGMPLLRRQRPHVAWYGDMELLGHLWRLAGLGRLTVTVEFHPPVEPEDFPSRRALADHCRHIIADGLSRAIHDRLTP